MRAAPSRAHPSMDMRTMRAQRFLYPSASSRSCLAASMLAGESVFGADSIEMTEMRIDSTCQWQCAGRHEHATCA